MIDADGLGLVLGGIATLATAVLGGVAALSSSRSKRATSDVRSLTKHVGTLDKQVNTLASWQVAARMYIWQLRSTLADRGIRAPEPPPELGLAAEIIPTKGDTSA